jgi:hypothetical protein
MVIAYRVGARAVFLYGFAKNERDNISADEMVTLREIGAGWLAATEDVVAASIDSGAPVEICNECDYET